MSARHAGFSILELTIAIGVTLALMTTIFAVVQSSHGMSAEQAESADAQQRLRVAVDTLTRDLLMAGAGAYVPGHAGPLNASFAPVLPFRRGVGGGDAAGTFKADTITVVHVPTTAAQTTLTADFGPGSTTMHVAPLSGCASGFSLCSFSTGMTLLVYDDAGAFQLFSVAAVLDAVSELEMRESPSTVFYAGAPVVEARIRTYYLKADSQLQIFQLMQNDGTANPDVPVLDHVVGLAFEYAGDPVLAGSLTPLTSADLVDGPWRPDAASPDRWDADLLRIRTVGVTIRLQAALAALRGPAGVLFTNGGTATDARRWVPDQEIRFQVSPRNLNLRQ